jgi:hypothetical protein
LFAASILAYRHPGERLIVETDASNFVNGGVLSQAQNGQELVIAYYSKTLNKAERDYCMTRRELLPIIRTLEHFHKYFYLQAIHMCTDHSALSWVMSFKNLEVQTARCVQRIQEYNITSEHRQGGKQTCRNSLKTALPRRMYSLSQGRVTGRLKASKNNFSPTRSRQGSSGSEIGTAKRHRHRAHSAGSRNWTTSLEERHGRPDFHKQKLLGPVEIACCKKRRTRGQLGIRQRTIQSS